MERKPFLEWNNVIFGILSPCLFNLHAEYIMWNTRVDESQAGIKIARKVSTTTDMQMILT